jgi:hypothetical protein
VNEGGNPPVGRISPSLEDIMDFVVFRCSKDPDTFVVTDEAHADQLRADVCPTPGWQLERVGKFSEMGKERLAFNEAIAKSGIRSRGYYLFSAKSFTTAEWPAAMP